MLSSGKYKFVCVTESQFNWKTPEASITLPGFEIFREDRSQKRMGGGSVVYVHESYTAEKLNFFENLESVALDISNDKGHHFILLCLYRSANVTESGNRKLIEALQDLCEFSVNGGKDILVVGDVNLPDADWDHGFIVGPANTTNKKLLMQKDMLNCFIDHGFEWYLDKRNITRRRMVKNNLQEALLDQVLCTKNDFILHVDKLAPFGKSDHLCLEVKLNYINSSEESNLVSSSKRMWSKCDPQSWLETAQSIDWKYSSNDLSVEEMWNELYGKFLQIEDTVPFNVQKKDNFGNLLKNLPWDASYLVRKRKQKDKAWAEFDINPSNSTFYVALGKQNEYESAELKAKTKHESKIVKNLKYNCKPFFHYLNSQKKSNSHVTKLKKDDGKVSSSATESVEILANHFHSVFKDEQFGPLPEHCYQSRNISGRTCNKDMPTINDLFEMVSKLLAGLNEYKSMGPDRMPPKLLKTLSADTEFVYAVAQLMFKCIECEEIPSMWKLAYIIPVHKKKGSYLDADNYRGISLTCILSKIYEKILVDYILDEMSHTLSPHQHGFRKGKSCLSNLLETMEQILNNLNNNQAVDILYFDFSKAFDSVSHSKLMLKLENLGLSAKIRNIIKDLISERKFQVKVGDVFSSVKCVLSGILQGSVIGPLLFLIFIDDLPGLLNCCTKLFADDLKILANPNDLSTTATDLETLELWQETWSLRFNLEKCKVVHVLQNDEETCLTTYPFLDACISSAVEEKDLGVVFDGKMDFNQHIHNCIQKAKSKFGWLKRELICRDAEVFLPVYKQLIRPHLEYCTQVWAPPPEHGNWSLIMNIEAVQREVTKIISGLENFSYKERLDSLKLTTLLERRMRGDLIEAYKILNGFADYGKNWFNISERTGKLLLDVNKGQKRNFFTNRVVKYYNRLPNNVKMSTTINMFKNRLDHFRNLYFQEFTYNHYWELSYFIFNRTL